VPWGHVRGGGAGEASDEEDECGEQNGGN
jgi:hypothetical protein